jgi:iron-sulfur cluster insertion protein
MHNIQFTERAVDEVELIIKNDFTLEGKHFRISISGKGCDGFDYSAGFSKEAPKDSKIEIIGKDKKFFVLLDPFASYYLKNVLVEFVQDFTQDAEGFIIRNHDQKEFHGKFWRSSPEKVPTI